MNEDISKLPKWAQDHIRALEQRVAYAKAQVAAHDEPDSPITWCVGMRNEAHGLHRHANVRFETPTGWIEIGMTQDGELRVYSQNTIAVMPRAANSINLENR